MIRIKFFRHEQWLITVRGDRVGVIRKNGQQFGWLDHLGGHWYSTQQEAIDALVRRAPRILFRRKTVQRQSEIHRDFAQKVNRFGQSCQVPLRDRGLVEPMP